MIRVTAGDVARGARNRVDFPLMTATILRLHRLEVRPLLQLALPLAGD